jgi:peptide deformylase
MISLKLTPLKPTDKQLRTHCKEVERKELRSKQLQRQIDELLAFVYGNNKKDNPESRRRPITVGLSANQVGIMKRISIVDLAIGQKDFNDIHVLINPVITKRGKATVQKSEGCVNLPGIWGPVIRAKTVTVKALDRSGNQLVLKLSGWPAILLQHEIDHLDGKLFIDHLEDPSRAHAVADDQIREYNKKTVATWPHTIDVRHLLLHD